MAYKTLIEEDREDLYGYSNFKKEIIAEYDVSIEQLRAGERIDFDLKEGKQTEWHLREFVLEFKHKEMQYTLKSAEVIE